MNLETVNQSLLDNAAKDDFAGYDPFDGLNSRLFNVLQLNRVPLFRLIWLQFHKRSIVNFRPIVGIPKRRNPKGIGLFILGLLEDYKRTSDASYLHQAKALGDWLLTQKSDASHWQYACWGYHFDWHARAFFVPKGKPNIITTVYVGRALYALGEQTGDARYTDAAIDSSHFVVKKLLNNNAEKPFFAYIPGEKAFVHNASLWGAAWVGFIASKVGNDEYLKMAQSVACSSVKAQASDGSWVYGELHHHQFIDGFHTGYNLEALSILKTALQTDEFDVAIDRGLEFYKTQFFDEQGAAKYYQNNPYPFDMHSVAQAIITLQHVKPNEDNTILMNRIIRWSLDNMYLTSKKRFTYQVNRYFRNNVNYMRWTQAWVYYSFAMYNAANNH